MNNLTLGSLFDGSGGFPLGGLISGITPVWASEIEPFPIRVTTKRLPFMKHYGDISAMDGSKIEPVDIICFGSPCTDMSVAGRRAGLEGQQSVLFYQAIRIIKEMRCATNGKYPRWICWENVPGAFSSNGGLDFKAVLDSVIGVIEEDAQVPMPEKNRWPYADCYMGEGWSVAYRVLDAQHWGVPQRRKRIYLVADFAGGSAFDILFKSEGLSGYSAESFRAWQRTACGAEGCSGATGFDGYNGDLTGLVSSTLGVNCGMSTGRNGIVLNDQGGNRMDFTDEVTATLRAEAHHPPVVMEAAGFCTEHSSKSRSIGYEEETSPTLRAGVVPATVYENHSQDTRYTGPVDTAPTVSATYGMGGNNQPFVVSGEQPSCNWDGQQTAPTLTAHNAGGNQRMPDKNHFNCVLQAYGISSKDSNAMKSSNPHSGIYKAETSRTLDANGGNPSCNQGGTIVIEGNGSRPSHQGDGFKESDVMYTLNTVDRHAVYSMTTGSFAQVSEDMAPTVLARDYKDPTAVCYGIGRDTFNQGKNAKFAPTFVEELQPTLVAKGPGAIQSGYTVRRLTPTECARLQGFPDWWCDDLGTEEPTMDDLRYWYDVFETHRRIVGNSTKPKSLKQIAKWLRDPHSDAAEYKMWGNGVALPCVVFVLSGIVYSTQNDANHVPT
ncbi:MAG: DNA cytosine methyltransferase [Oscillospiraceae bacterium]|nr:DNA cytosine methyltransferase [Oscillospiraceae bacterium]